MKNVIVVFTENSARIHVNPANAEELLAEPHALLNPDLSAVKGLPPHLWKLSGNKIVPMSEAAQAVRQADVLKRGVIQRPLQRKLMRDLLWFCLGIGVGLAARIAEVL